MEAVRFRNVSVVRDGNRILGPLDLSVQEGECIALIGRNGSGKTTLSQLIRGEVRPYYDEADPAEYLIFGRKDWDIFELRNIVPSVSFDTGYYFESSIHVYEAVLTGFFGSYGIYRNHKVTEDMCQTVRDVCSSLGISDLLDREYGTLSLGERKLVLIARALAVSPRMLILDEPTSSLDMVAKDEFRGKITELIGKGIGIVLITHDLEDIPDSIRRAVLLKGGRIVADGPKEEVLTSENVSLAYGCEIDAVCENGVYRMYRRK